MKMAMLNNIHNDGTHSPEYHALVLVSPYNCREHVQFYGFIVVRTIQQCQ